MRSYNFCHTNTKNPGNNLGIFCLITGWPNLNGYGHRIDGNPELTQLFLRNGGAGIEVVDTLPDREHKALGRIATDNIILDAKGLGL